VLAASLLVYGCLPQPSPDLFAPTEAQIKLRSFQTRTFDVNDRQVALRAVIAALQDLGAIIEHSNEPLGLVNAKLVCGPNNLYIVSIVVTVHHQAGGRMMIRANSTYTLAGSARTLPLEDPKIYQNLFVSVERSLFIAKE
jgi:hypothetical protein